MVKRYYCDYCDSSYPYSVEARKKHTQGHHHQKLKKLHYDKCKSAKEILEIETNKDKCRIFHTGRKCDYGDSCRFSHLTPVDIEKLKQDVIKEEELQKQRNLPNLMKKGKEPSLEEWLSKLEGKEGPSSRQLSDEVDEFISKYKLPDCLTAHSNLPPSLIPPSEDTLLRSTFQEWG